MNTLIIVLRWIHILSGVFWVGSSIFLGVFVSPAVAATADAGQKFMAYLVMKSKITLQITIAAILTVLAGCSLYVIDANLTSGWASTPEGWGFSLGGFFGIIGFIFGIFVGRNVGILGRIASEVQGKPTTEQMDRIKKAQAQMKIVAPASMFALILTLTCMATAAYW